MKVDALSVVTDLAVVHELSLAQLDELEAAMSAFFKPSLGIPKVRARHHRISMP